MVIQGNRSNQGNWSTMNDVYNDEMSTISKNLLFDSSNPNDDMWRKFALPITPPSSPKRSIGESSDCNSDTTEDIADRLQDVCDSLDSAFDIHTSVPSDASSLRSKLISDCMWSGNHHIEVVNRTKSSISCPQKKLSIDTEEDLYPTPCASPLPSVTEGTDYPSSNECVDPTSVFPLHPSQETIPSILSGQSDTDEEIDVVTVDSITIPTISIGTKRKQTTGNTIILAKIQNTSSSPSFKRTKSSPAKLSSTEKERLAARRMSSPDESDPETRRATHNVLERKRRIDLKKSFERLRESVPNLEKIDKTPKVIVLKKAAMHIEELNREEVELEGQKKILLKEKEELLQKMNLLVSQRDHDMLKL